MGSGPAWHRPTYPVWLGRERGVVPQPEKGTEVTSRTGRWEEISHLVTENKEHSIWQPEAPAGCRHQSHGHRNGGQSPGPGGQGTLRSSQGRGPWISCAILSVTLRYCVNLPWIPVPPRIRKEDGIELGAPQIDQSNTTVFRQNPFSRKPQYWLLRPLTGWVRPNPIIRDPLISSNSVMAEIDHIYKILSR